MTTSPLSPSLTSFGMAGRPLRILIVDDNHINLSMLSRLLKRRFSHILDGAPTTVDSGLKAIQLLRLHVFDCILMDIQMPFLSGLEASRRIRNAEDGILSANSSAHIVAVTTAVGDEPELAYRRAEMDGMIGKPVRFDQLSNYLSPLSQQAAVAARKRSLRLTCRASRSCHLCLRLAAMTRGASSTCPSTPSRLRHGRTSARIATLSTYCRHRHAHHFVGAAPSPLHAVEAPTVPPSRLLRTDFAVITVQMAMPHRWDRVDCSKRLPPCLTRNHRPTRRRWTKSKPRFNRPSVRRRTLVLLP